MKKITLSFLFYIFFFAFSLNAQTSKKQNINTQRLMPDTKECIKKTGYARCLTVENEIALQKQYPNRATTQEFEQMLAPIVARIKSERLAGKVQAIYNIPVVIHVIHNGDPINTNGTVGNENISDTQALSQINVMNQDYRMLAGTPGGANSTGVAVDVQINFCMAQTDPNGNLTNGVVRHNITPYSNAQTPSIVDDWEIKSDVETMKANTQWDPTKYLNMWTFKPGGNPLNATVNPGLGGLLGYAQFPSNSGLGGLNTSGGAANTDGVVAAYNAFGTIASDDGSFTLNSTYNLGRTMTHEVGHWLGLRHIWGDTNTCTNDDFCADTPDATAANYSCVTVDSCPADGLGNDQIQNYMDYTNDSCMDTFTQNQKDRIQAVMSVSPRRVELNSSTVCTAPNTPYFSITPINTNQSTCVNDVVFDFSYTQFNGFNENTVFTATGNPAGSSVTITPSSLNVNGNFSLTVGNLVGTANGNYTISVIGTSPSMTKSVNVTLTIGLCSSIANTAYATSTTLVSIGTINNSSAKPSGYSDYTAMATNVIVGQSYPLTVNVNTDGTPYDVQTKVWIDWNQNCIFDVPSEEYDLGSATGTANGPTSLSPINIVPPSTAVTGTTIMRVSSKYTDAIGTSYPTPCENGADGEVEDYTFNVIGIVLGVNKSEFAQFNIYPNPTNRTVNIMLSSHDDVKISLSDISGRVIYQKTINNKSSIFNQEIDFGNISSGIYLLNVKSGNRKATKKLIIK